MESLSEQRAFDKFYMMNSHNSTGSDAFNLMDCELFGEHWRLPKFVHPVYDMSYKTIWSHLPPFRGRTP